MAGISRNAGMMFQRTLGNSAPRFSRFLSTETVSSPSIDPDVENPTAIIEAKRNKSRLNSKHYKELKGIPSVDVSNPTFPYQQTVNFRRKVASKFGQSSGINLGIAWPSKDKLQLMMDYEKVAYPSTLQEVVEQKRKLREEEHKLQLDRQMDIESKVSKLGGWIKELKARQNKKLHDAKAAQEKKDALIEEVRQHFGYLVSVKDPKFQEMLELKEKEMKKASKEAKKKTIQEKKITKIVKSAESLGS